MCGKTGRSAVSAQALMVPYGGTAGACPLRQRLARRGLVAQHFVVSHCRCQAVAWGRWIGGAIGGESMNQKWQEAKDRTFEARKPYLAKQLDLYSETTGVVGLMLAMNPDKGDEYGEVMR